MFRVFYICPNYLRFHHLASEVFVLGFYSNYIDVCGLSVTVLIWPRFYSTILAMAERWSFITFLLWNYGSNDNSNLKQDIFLRNKYFFNIEMSKSHHLILVEKESIVRFWSIQLLWIRGDYQTQWLDDFQINQVKVLSSSHQVCSSDFQNTLFPYSHEAQRWSIPALSPKQTPASAADRSLTPLWPSHLLWRTNAFSCYRSDFTYYIFS